MKNVGDTAKKTEHPYPKMGTDYPPYWSVSCVMVQRPSNRVGVTPPTRKVLFMTVTFESVSLKRELLDNLKNIGFTAMTPIQARALPLTLQGKDIIAKAQTGSGKTAAFGLHILQQLQVKRFRVQSLVLCPTRELSQQVSKELRTLARMLHNVKILTLTGGQGWERQFHSLRHGAHIVVGTPGRLLGHLEKGTLSLEDLQHLVLDEADRMLDMGFEEEVNKIISHCPKKRQTLLFSATYPKDIQSISEAHQVDPVYIEAEETKQHQDIEQRVFAVTEETRIDILEQLLLHYQPSSALVFCQMKRQVHDLAIALQERGFEALPIHGDLEQSEREEMWLQFANHSCPLLIATDVAARGLDVKELPLVVNYNISEDPEVHVHRIGRTGRAGNKGLALSLVSSSELRLLRAVEALTGESLTVEQAENLETKGKLPAQGSHRTIVIFAGKKHKLRPGDILGALTKDAGLPGADVGKIDIFPTRSYVAIHRRSVKQAYNHLRKGKMKNRHYNVNTLRSV